MPPKKNEKHNRASETQAGAQAKPTAKKPKNKPPSAPAVPIPIPPNVQGRTLDLKRHRPDSLFLVVFENNSQNIVRSKPYFDALSRAGLFLKNYFGTSRPSQTAYLALTGGSTFGVTTDVAVNLPDSNVFDLLDKRRVSWKVYAENYAGGHGKCNKELKNVCRRETNFVNECNPCPSNANELIPWFARYHVPPLQFTNITGNPKRCAKVVNAQQLQSDIIREELPQFAMYIPNLYDGGHNTNAAYSNEYLMTTFSTLLRDPRFMRNRVVVFLYDEDGAADVPPDQTRCNSKQKVPAYCVFLGPNVRAHETLQPTYTHYNMLRFVEEHFRLGTLGRCDSKNGPIRDVFQKPPRSSFEAQMRLGKFIQHMEDAIIEAARRPVQQLDPPSGSKRLVQD